MSFGAYECYHFYLWHYSYSKERRWNPWWKCTGYRPTFLSCLHCSVLIIHQVHTRSTATLLHPSGSTVSPQCSAISQFAGVALNLLYPTHILKPMNSISFLNSVYEYRGRFSAWNCTRSNSKPLTSRRKLHWNTFPSARVDSINIFHLI